MRQKENEGAAPTEPLPEPIRTFCRSLADAVGRVAKEAETDPRSYARSVVTWARSRGSEHVAALRAELDAPEDTTR